MLLKGGIKTALYHHGFHDVAWGDVCHIRLNVVANSGQAEYGVVRRGKQDRLTLKTLLKRV
jgi:hypothetical protein